jgi:hypothetical protein
MIQVIDARVIEKETRPHGFAPRPAFKGNSPGDVVAGGYVLVVTPVKHVGQEVFWGDLPWPRAKIVLVSMVHFEEVASDPWEKWRAQLEGFRQLKTGWNSYTAPAPADGAIHNARVFLDELRAHAFEPTRVAPSAMGGIAITRRQGERKGFVEFYNDGRVYALLSDRKGEKRVFPIPVDAPSFREFILQMRDYLDG